MGLEWKVEPERSPWNAGRTQPKRAGDLICVRRTFDNEGDDVAESAKVLVISASDLS